VLRRQLCAGWRCASLGYGHGSCERQVSGRKRRACREIGRTNEFVSRTRHAVVAIAGAFLAHGADGEGIVIGDAGEVHLRAHIDAGLISALIVALRECDAFRVGYTNGVIVFAKTARSGAAEDAVRAVVCPIAAGLTAIVHLIDAAACGAFLAIEAIGQVDVGIDAIGVRLAACGWAHGVIGGAGVDAVDQKNAIETQRAGLQFVRANAIECTRCAGGAIHGGFASTRRGACAIETGYAWGTNVTAHTAIGFVDFDVHAFGAALGQTRTARRLADATGANFAERTSFSAHAAIARIELRIDTNAIAFRRAADALRVAHAIRANLAHGTSNATRAAVAGVDFGVDARIGAFRRAARAIEVAFAARAHFAGATHGAARAAIETVIADVDASSSAFRRSADAIQAALSIRANFASRANGAAHTAIGHVGLEIDA
jgi:hypothetical protein